MVRIALAEDDRDIGGMMASYLSRSGFDVRFFEQPAEMVREKAWQSADVLVSDYFMAGLDGIELAQIFRKNGFRGPIFLVSAFAETEMEKNNPALAPFFVLVKPFRPAELVRRLRAETEFLTA